MHRRNGCAYVLDRSWNWSIQPDMNPTLAIAGVAVLVGACTTEHTTCSTSDSSGDRHAGDGGAGAGIAGVIAPTAAGLDDPCGPPELPPPPAVLALFALVGDSNTMGFGVTDKADRGFAVTVPNANVIYNARYAFLTADPPAWVDMATGDLRAYAPGGEIGMGIELTFCETMHEASASPWLAKLAISGSTLATEWTPTATFMLASTGSNAFDTWVARMHGFEASAGRKLSGVVVNLGTNDAFERGNASTFGANMAAFAAATRSAFGADLVIVWIKTNASTSAPFVSTVTRAQVAVADADPLMALVDTDDIPLLADRLHYDTDGYLTIGQRCAFALLDKLGFARHTVSVTPQVLGWGPAAHGAGALLPRSWPGTQVGDREYLVVTTGLLDVAIATPSGWSDLGVGSASRFLGLTERMAIYERQVTSLDANGRPPATTVIDTNNLNAAKIFTVRGPSTNPTTNAAVGFASNTYNTGPTAIPGVTTTAANDLVMMFAGGYSGSGTNGMTTTNAGLRDMTARQNGIYNITADFQVISLTTGTMVTPGPTGSGLANSVNNALVVAATVAVKAASVSPRASR
jgi:hypothetical protein